MVSVIPQSDYPGLPPNLEDEFRLVEIQPGKPEDPICCNLFTTRARDSPKYEALSYTWGNPDDKQSIQCRAAAGDRAGHLLVTQNCASALRRLRLENSPRTVWIDSICIDQNEITERNHQLGLMARIYTQAEQVVIHLGEASEDSDRQSTGSARLTIQISVTSHLTLMNPRTGLYVQKFTCWNRSSTDHGSIASGSCKRQFSPGTLWCIVAKRPYLGMLSSTSSSLTCPRIGSSICHTSLTDGK